MKVEKLLDVVQIKNPKPEKFSGEKRYYSTGNIDEYDVSENFGLVKFENRPSRANVQPIENSVGFAKMKSTTKTLLVTKNYSECIFSTGMNFLLPSEHIISKYLYYYLISPYFLDLKDKYSGQGIMGGLSNNDLNLFKIPVPSLQEQEKIVERLDKVFDKIQHIENKLTTEVNFINNFKKSFIKNKFDNNTYEFQKLEDIFEITSSKRVFKSEWTNSGIPFLRARELVKLANNLEFKDPIFISESHYKKIKNKYGVPKNGDILITGVGTLGITYLVNDEEKFYFKDGNIIWLKSLNKVNSEFIKLYIDSPDIQTKINNKIGATVKTFTISDANKLEVPVPPKKIQDKLINEIKNFNILLNNFKELNSMKIKKLSLLKKSILNKEFSYEWSRD